MRIYRSLFAVAWGCWLLADMAASPAGASVSLEVSPVLVDVPNGAAVSSVDIRNDDTQPAAIQVRLFRWSQSDGEEHLTPTADVVVSPPIATVAGRSSLNVRVIRVAKAPVQGEEAYRLVVDQLPRSDPTGRTVVAVLLRQVLPVFFSGSERSPPAVEWSVARGPHGYVLRARNNGDQRLRVAKAVLAGGRSPIALGGGLLGYVLGHSEMSWSLPARQASFGPRARYKLRADTDRGPLDVSALAGASE